MHVVLDINFILFFALKSINHICNGRMKMKMFKHNRIINKNQSTLNILCSIAWEFYIFIRIFGFVFKFIYSKSWKKISNFCDVGQYFRINHLCRYCASIWLIQKIMFRCLRDNLWFVHFEINSFFYSLEYWNIKC